MFPRITLCFAALLAGPAVCFAQFGQLQVTRGFNTAPLGVGLRPPELRTPRIDTNDPFFRTEFRETFPTFGRGLPPGIFREFGHDFTDFDGTPGSINRFDGREPFFDPFRGLTPNEVEARGDYARDAGTGVGRRAYGVGTGSGNQYAGFGAYNYGTTAGLGLMFSGMGDYYAGQGDYMRGAGDYEHANSLANINNEEAQYRDLKNEQYATDTFFEKRRMNIQARIREKELRRSLYEYPSADTLSRLQDLRRPYSLAAHEYDEFTGRLFWPAVLRENGQFAADRETINVLFENRMKRGVNTGLGTHNQREVREAAQEMKSELKENIDELSPMAYVQAKKFIEGVEHEALQEPDMVAPVTALLSP